MWRRITTSITSIRRWTRRRTRRRDDVIGSRQKESYTTLKNDIYRLFPWRRPDVEATLNYLKGVDSWVHATGKKKTNTISNRQIAHCYFGHNSKLSHRWDILPARKQPYAVASVCVYHSAVRMKKLVTPTCSSSSLEQLDRPATKGISIHLYSGVTNYKGHWSTCLSILQVYGYTVTYELPEHQGISSTRKRKGAARRSIFLYC